MVEDEIVTREGIRDNVDWRAAGFEFCGEAPDGEIALQLIEESQPDVLITDIKMPFLDGLQLSKIVREHMPWVKIIILSGHDEFNYAQAAVKLGVTEYLLKPISAYDLNKVLARIAAILDQERKDHARLKSLETRFEDTLALSREKFLLDLLMGAVSSSEAIEKSEQLGIDVVGKYYQAALIQIELCDASRSFDYHQYKRIEQIVSEFTGSNLDVYLTKKDFEELALFFKGETCEQLVEETKFLSQLVVNEIEKQINCKIIIEMGSIQDRLGNVHFSFLDALLKSKSVQSLKKQPFNMIGRTDLAQINHEAVGDYLKFGIALDFDKFFSNVIQPIGEIALRSYLMKQYLFVDLIVKTSQFKQNLGVGGEESAMEMKNIENTLNKITSMEDIKSETRRIIIDAITLRDEQVTPERIQLLQKTKAYLDEKFSNPDLKMSEVAKQFNISPSYFSTIFQQEFGETFRDSLAKRRITKAKELLRSTNLKIVEIAFRCGYKDSHYFSYVFMKKTGFTPSQFRGEPKANKQEE